jgi:hypothetical protein
VAAAAVEGVGSAVAVVEVQPPVAARRANPQSATSINRVEGFSLIFITSPSNYPSVAAFVLVRGSPEVPVLEFIIL